MYSLVEFADVIWERLTWTFQTKISGKNTSGRVGI